MYLSKTFVYRTKLPELTEEPNCPEKVKRAKCTKCQTNASVSIEGQKDAIYDGSDGDSATLDDSKEWEGDGDEDGNKFALSGNKNDE